MPHCWKTHVAAHLFYNLNWVIWLPNKRCWTGKQCKPPKDFFFKSRLIWVSQGCGNTMPELSDLVQFHTGQVENFYLLVLGQVQVNKNNTILYFIFWLIITSSHVVLKKVWILISWLLQKPADLNLHCLQESWYLVSYCFLNCQRVNCLSTERYKLICVSDK